jgi:hypothetical protein
MPPLCGFGHRAGFRRLAAGGLASTGLALKHLFMTTGVVLFD